MSQIAKYVKDGVEYYNPIACNCEPTPLQGKLPPKFKASQTITETHFEIAPNLFMIISPLIIYRTISLQQFLLLI
jgi:hypothetical protein